MKGFWGILLMLMTSFNLSSQRAYENLPALIAHGAGGYDGEVYTNSVEALESSLQSGYVYVELDLSLTSDSCLVAVHDWQLFNDYTGFPELGSSVLTQAEFESRRLFSKYTPITYKTIIEYLEKYPDWVLVTDKLDDVSILDKIFSSYKDRIIVEAFSLDAFYSLIEHGFNAMLSSKDSELQTLIGKSVESMIMGKAPIDFITIYYTADTEEIGRFQCLFPLNVAAYTVNEEDFVAEHLGKEFVLIYTDFLK